MKFYCGMFDVHHAGRVEHAFININRVRRRKKPVPSADWILDSGAFSELVHYGCYRHGPEQYAAEVDRLAELNPGLTIAVAQDYMCEPFMLARTGLNLADHQRLTIERYVRLLDAVRLAPIMPVLQGYSLASYLEHLEQYGRLLELGAYVGVGSICKRNTDTRQIEAILCAIHRRRPDLRLHGFGIKISALYSGVVRECLHSADSMAWSWHARRHGRDASAISEALAFEHRIRTMPVQYGWKF